MAFFCSQFPLSSLPPHRSSASLKTSVSDTLNRRTITLKTSEISISSSVNRHYRVLPTLRCCTSSGSSIEDLNSPSTRIFIKENNHVYKAFKIIDAGLPQSTSEGCLVTEFSRFGKVNRVKIITGRKSRQSLGLAYVWFTSEESAQLAAKEMDGKFFGGRFIVVTFARPESPTSQNQSLDLKSGCMGSASTHAYPQIYREQGNSLQKVYGTVSGIMICDKVK